MALLTEDEIERRVAALQAWSVAGDAIRRELDGGDFAGSVALVNGILPIAEELGHHPDLRISWDTVEVTISTHSEGGLTAADFELAERLDGLA